ncbi:MAG: hypothetical protein ABEH38_09905 [Flavobacteriales bacterium]
MNAFPSSFIIHKEHFFMIPLLLIIACGSSEEKHTPGTGSKSKGMLEKKDAASELKGRIQTLRRKFQKIKEAPSKLQKKDRKRWSAKIQQADSILDTLKKKAKGLKKTDSTRPMRRQIDRILQRLAVQAQQMKRSAEKGAKGPHP